MYSPTIYLLIVVFSRRFGSDDDYSLSTQSQKNAHLERYNRTVRYDWLAHHLFSSISEIQDFAMRWLWTYNHERPTMVLGRITIRS
ncbi:MAG: transposase [SAR86 cluster bacterium]|uniref:Transposase n=1 Tax=SAR86 cluster bacterium TaxID=2030880 RepID=A0A973A888_9GAMM|nr:transposase [SAR86 cluster bacterium]